MKALFICENLMKAIASKEIVNGCVHSVFDSACNIETEHKFITLLNREKEMAPMSAIVDNGEKVNFKKLNLTQNLNFSFRANGISCGQENIFISLDNAEMWFPGVMLKSSNCLEKELLGNVKTMEIGLNTYGKLYGISPLVGMIDEDLPDLELAALQVCSTDKNFEFIRYRFLTFIQAVLKGDFERITQTAESIIGFGAGLTPAMDDFICGIMISFVYLGNYYKLNLSQIYKFNRKLISNSLNKTTKVSSEMLKHSAEGETSQAVRELMQAILNQQNEVNIINALVKTVDLGETSGSDIALGIYVGCKIMTNLKYRGEWLNESMC